MGITAVKRHFATFAVLIGLFVTVITAMHLAEFLEWDSCADAGGRYNKATGACTFDTSREYVAQFSRPGLFAFWAIFLGLSALPGWLIYRVVCWSGTLKTIGDRPRFMVTREGSGANQGRG